MNKKQEILDAAINLLIYKGDISRLNLRQIARGAGCAHTNVYNYFPNFEALKWALLEEALKRLERYMLRGSEEKKDPLELIARYISFALDQPSLYKLIWINELDPASAPADTSFLSRIPEKLASVLPEDKADILHSYVHGKLLNILFFRIPPEEIEVQKKLIIENCRKML